jgi:GNAT superfamily N-acetyltransferase
VPPENLRIYNLAAHPQRIAAVAELRWREWAEDGESSAAGIGLTAQEGGTDRLAMTLIATGHDDEVWGAVDLRNADRALTDAERAGRAPWLLGLIVDPAHRRQQVGRLLVDAFEELALNQGHEQVWMATGE